MSQENFLQQASDYLDILKLRVSYGLLGNQNIGNYPYAAVINPGYGYYLGDKKNLYQELHRLLYLMLILVGRNLVS